MRYLYSPMLVALAACAGTPGAKASVGPPSATAPRDIVSSVDKFTGDSAHRTTAERLDGGGFGHAGVDLSFALLSPKYSQADHYWFPFITITYRGSTWMFIESGGSLLVKVGDSTFTLETAGSVKRDVVTGSSVIESASYPVSPSQIALMASVPVVEIKLLGSKGSEERRFSKGAEGKLKTFAKLFAPESGRRFFTK